MHSARRDIAHGRIGRAWSMVEHRAVHHAHARIVAALHAFALCLCIAPVHHAHSSFKAKHCVMHRARASFMAMHHAMHGSWTQIDNAGAERSWPCSCPCIVPCIVHGQTLCHCIIHGHASCRCIVLCIVTMHCARASFIAMHRVVRGSWPSIGLKRCSRLAFARIVLMHYTRASCPLIVQSQASWSCIVPVHHSLQCIVPCMVLGRASCPYHVHGHARVCASCHASFMAERHARVSCSCIVHGRASWAATVPVHRSW
ncbi:hypothetical protein NL676_029940 [Syzygium grande]|nr:hypothetical protein NL676_029940 [Syzygium grande]